MDAGAGADDIAALAAECGLRVVADAAKRTRTVAARSFRRGSVLVAIHPLHAFPLRAGEDGAPDAVARGADSGGAARDAAGAGSGVGPETRCAHCFGALPQRRPRCSRCRQAEYCSMACLTRHWAARHHFECGRLDARAVDAAAAKIKPEFRPCLRMAAGIGAAVAGPAPAAGPRWLRVQRAAWDRLVSHRERHPGYVLRQYGEIARVIAAATGGGGLRGAEDDTITALCRSGCNNFAASEPHGVRTAGHLCSPLVSLLLNHSCLPNAAFAYSPASGRQVVRALADIAEGDEVTLSYADGLLPRAERRKLLDAVYFFHCSCAKCCGGGGARAQIDALMDRAPDSADQVPERLPTDYASPPAIEPWATRVLALLAAAVAGDGPAPCTGDSPLERSLLGAVADVLPRNLSFAAYRHWLECQDECLERIAAGQPAVHPWACVAALYVLAFYALAYPPFHPLVGRQCLEAAKLAWNSLQLAGPGQGSAHAAVASAARARDLTLCAQRILAATADPDAADAAPSPAQEQAALLIAELDRLAASSAEHCA
ncbi:hypothetical protein H4R21_002383 [Coemansia helicoidea]|uniref:Uncharacterized protein n=1 Tax=Coemansia helicoidea TaxID=1286919 RepID=A0ACC1L6Q5_9FUNG|nr:hypothetical protein H4R21_002383 [Coemansia helicoidea]